LEAKEAGHIECPLPLFKYPIVFNVPQVILDSTKANPSADDKLDSVVMYCE